MVRTNTIVGPGCDSAVIYIKDANKAIAVKTDCNGRYVYLNPKEGAKIAVAESARNVVCSGAEPLAITNCLNFGNPYKPENYWQFKMAIEGMGEACRVLNTPVTGGNVSFYNESPESAVYPTPTIGMLGLIENMEWITTSYFKNPGDLIYILGDDYEEVGGSEFLYRIHNIVSGEPPVIDLEKEKKLFSALLDAIRSKIILSAHDVSDGGVLIALGECSIINSEKLIGAKVEIPVKTREDFSFFSESQSRIIVSISKSNQKIFEEIMIKHNQPYRLLGETIESLELIANHKYKFDLNKIYDVYYNSIERALRN
jgi:phosphoribosylformylglycinamidine synthase